MPLGKIKRTALTLVEGANEAIFGEATATSDPAVLALSV